MNCPQCKQVLIPDLHNVALECCPACTFSLERVQANLWLQAESPAELDSGFDKRWEKHPRSQATTSFAQLQQKLGFTEALVRGAKILEAGCGCGRYLPLLLECGAQEVWGMDVSPHACHAAAAQDARAAVVQSSVEHAPFEAASFDIVYSIGVLHHTQNPAASFARIAELVRPGGYLAVWVYSHGAPYVDPRYAVVREFFHAVTRACPPDKLYEAVERYACAMRDAYAGEWNILAQVVGTSTSKDAEECISDTFDWHCPQHRSVHSYDEVESWFQTNGFDVTWKGTFPASVGGIRRA
jgi:SAM-dependent methyltransferase